MKILITGGFGYVGGRLAQYFVEQGYDVCLGSRFKSDSPIWLPKATVMQTRWNVQRDIEKACDGVDLIIHAAGMNASDCSIDIKAALKFNGACTARLLETAVDQGVKRFIYLSTAHVYSSPLVGTITEDTQLTNTHPYATSRRAGEDAVLRISQRGDIEGIVLRLSNVVGSPMHAQTNCWSLLFPDLCRQAVVNRTMVLRSNGLQRRDFVSLFDVCRAMNHLINLSQHEIFYSVFNLGGTWAPTVLDVALFIQKQCELVLGFQPKLSCFQTSSDESSNFLDYQSNHLSQIGFKHSGNLEMEVYNLLMFCRTYFT